MHPKHSSGSAGHVPPLVLQSPAQFAELSPFDISQVPSPQTAPTGQSAAHVDGSLPSHTAFPQTSLLPPPVPQSDWQTPISLDAQTASPQTGALEGGGSVPSSPPPPSVVAHAANIAALKNASSVVVLIARHRTNRKYEINDKLRKARR